MANEVILKRSAIQGKIPTALDLALGEIAINTYDGKMYIKKNDGSESIVEIGAGVGGGSGVFTSDGTTIKQDSANGYVEDFIVGASTLNNNSIPAEYSKLFFDKGLSALRVGYVSDDSWDNTNVGQYSFAGGYNSKASGQYSFAFGSSTDATNIYSFAFGNNSIASGQFSVSFGSNSKATGNYSYSFGYNCKTSYQYSFTAGYNNNNLGYNTVMIGSNNTTGNSSSSGSVILGDLNSSYNASYNNLIGYNNYADNMYNSQLGQNNSSSKIYSNIIGFSGVSNSSYSDILSLGYKNNPGDSQIVRKIMGTQTTNTNLNYVSSPIGLSGDGIILNKNSLVSGVAQFNTLNKVTNECKIIEVKFGFKRNATGTTTILYQDKVTKYEDANMATSDANFVVSNNNITIQFQAANANTTRFLATLQYNEMI